MPPTAPTDYGASNKYGFHDPRKWHTEFSVPILDEHEMTGSDGKPIATVDRHILQEIANNNNKKVWETGNPATLILGHTSDEPGAPEKPVKGFAVNFAVKPVRMPDGTTKYAIHADYKLRHKNTHLLEEFPAPSVELFWHNKDTPTIALLGGNPPERPLGMTIRKGRGKNAIIEHISLDTMPHNGITSVFGRTEDDLYKFSIRRNGFVERYSIEAPVSNKRPNRYAKGSPGGTSMPMNGPKSKVPQRYEDADMDTDDYDGGDDAPAGSDDFDADGGGDPVVEKVMQSKQMKQLMDMVTQIAQAVGVGGGQDDGMGGGGMDAPGGEPPMGGGEMPPPGGGMDAAGGDAPMPGGGGMDAPGGEPPMPDEESRRASGNRPVQMSGTGFPGSSDTYIPGMGNKGKGGGVGRMSRNGSQPMNNRNRSRGADPRDVQILRLRRQVAEGQAREAIAQLEREGILFGNGNPEVADRIKYARVEELTLAILHDEDTKDEGSPDSYVQDKIEEMRLCYARRKTDDRGRQRPPQGAGIAQYARNPTAGQGQPADEEFEPTSDEQVCEMADLAAGTHQSTRGQKVPMPEVMKYMRKKYGFR